MAKPHAKTIWQKLFNMYIKKLLSVRLNTAKIERRPTSTKDRDEKKTVLKKCEE